MALRLASPSAGAQRGTASAGALVSLVGRAACSKPGNSHPPAEAPLSLWARGSSCQSRTGSRGGADVELLQEPRTRVCVGEFREVPERSGVLPEVTGVAGPGHLVFWPSRGLKELVGGYMLSLSTI